MLGIQTWGRRVKETDKPPEFCRHTSFRNLFVVSNPTFWDLRSSWDRKIIQIFPAIWGLRFWQKSGLSKIITTANSLPKGWRKTFLHVSSALATVTASVSTVTTTASARSDWSRAKSIPCKWPPSSTGQPVIRRKLNSKRFPTYPSSVLRKRRTASSTATTACQSATPSSTSRTRCLSKRWKLWAVLKSFWGSRDQYKKTFLSYKIALAKLRLLQTSRNLFQIYSALRQCRDRKFPICRNATVCLSRFTAFTSIFWWTI